MIRQLKKKIEQLEKMKDTEQAKLTTETHGDLQLVIWGKLIVKILRGVSMDDL